MTGWLWSLATIVGPILLIAVIIYAYLRNRGGSRRQVERAERGAVEFREELDRDPEYKEE
jgi:cbb3-type cytochrome oxidase subunit 3